MTNLPVECKGMYNTGIITMVAENFWLWIVDGQIAQYKIKKGMYMHVL